MKLVKIVAYAAIADGVETSAELVGAGMVRYAIAFEGVAICYTTEQSERTVTLAKVEDLGSEDWDELAREELDTWEAETVTMPRADARRVVGDLEHAASGMGMPAEDEDNSYHESLRAMTAAMGTAWPAATKPAPKRFIINAGNSTAGAVGFVLRLEAESAEDALAKAKAKLPEVIPVSEHSAWFGATGGAGLRIYLNTDALTLADVEEDTD